MLKVLITGATGFIGGHIVDACLKKGWQVSALTLFGDQGVKALESKGVAVFYGDIRDLNAVNIATMHMDIVFHAAAFVSDWGSKEMFWDVTVKGTENICKAALKNGVKRLVKISTNDVFGLREDKILTENDSLVPWGEPYADTKLAAEEIAWDFYKKEGLPVTMVYPCWVYGPGDKTFVPLLADALLKNEMVFFRKHAIVWPAYVENVVDLLMTIAEHPNAVGNGYLVHDGEFTTLEAFSAEILKTYNKELKIRYLPFQLALFLAWIMEFLWKLAGAKQRPLLTTYTVKNLGSRLRFSIDKAKNELDWTPKIKYDQGMKITMEWLKKLNINSLKQK
jgi:nucleoside-diphosphate-sugar epimerase